VVTATDPGVLQGDSVETTLDAEWAGAVAPSATVKVIVAGSTNSADGIDLSALYAVTNNVAPVISLSYGSCEAFMGSSELAFYNSLWQQAAAQGQSVMVSSGDSGAAGCNWGGDSSGGYGRRD
jgi:subtilase family serine protease